MNQKYCFGRHGLYSSRTKPCRNISNFKWVSLKMNKSERNQVMWSIAMTIHKRDTSHPSWVQCEHNSEKNFILSLDASLPWTCMAFTKKW